MCSNTTIYKFMSIEERSIPVQGCGYPSNYILTIQCVHVYMYTAILTTLKATRWFSSHFSIEFICIHDPCYVLRSTAYYVPPREFWHVQRVKKRQMSCFAFTEKQCNQLAYAFWHNFNIQEDCNFETSLKDGTQQEVNGGSREHRLEKI